MPEAPTTRRDKYSEIIPQIPTTPEKLAQIVANTPPRKREDWKFVKRENGRNGSGSHN